MFKAGFFSSSTSNPCQVDGRGLKKIDAQILARAFQVSEANPLSGLEGRAGLLTRLADALREPKYFGADGRPGGMLGV